MFFHLSAAAIDDGLQYKQQQYVPPISPLLGATGSLQNVPPLNLSGLVPPFYQPLSHLSPTLFMPSLLSGTASSFMNSLISATTSVPAQHRKLFIGGLSHETSDEQLREYYTRWGQVVDCIVIRDPVSRQSRGFGFVTFATIDMADAAMADRPHTIDGKNVDPKRAIPREQMLQSANFPPFLYMHSTSDSKLFIAGIHSDFHPVDILRDYFQRFGELEQVEIIGQSGLGFVLYEDKKGAKKCLSQGKWHLINGRKIEIRKSEREGTTDKNESRSPSGTPFRSSLPPHSSQNYRKRGDGVREKLGNSIGSHGSQSHSPESTQSENS